jgi:hypothetical protein
MRLFSVAFCVTLLFASATHAAGCGTPDFVTAAFKARYPYAIRIILTGERAVRFIEGFNRLPPPSALPGLNGAQLSC